MESLPADPQAAAAAFYANPPTTPDAGDLVLVFPPAGTAHKDWRLAAVRDLARDAAPAARVNAVIDGDAAALATVLAYLADAPGVTGQIFELDGNSAQASLD
ncbi:Rossmann fold domain-containing protein [Alteraurantiacibacter buctensis]|uniref:Rossmann fold domain-containing protein n=1 Tax=Alteraurantiacibacter buctensis TaxID=1503981 RepID=UPI00301BA075